MQSRRAGSSNFFCLFADARDQVHRDKCGRNAAALPHRNRRVHVRTSPRTICRSEKPASLSAFTVFTKHEFGESAKSYRLNRSTSLFTRGDADAELNISFEIGVTTVQAIKMSANPHFLIRKRSLFLVTILTRLPIDGRIRHFRDPSDD